MALPPRDLRTWVEIDRQALRRNYERFRRLAGGTAVMAVVKSNAYGHGLVLIAKLLASYELKAKSLPLWFGVDSIVEALALRREGLRQPILVFGPTLPSRLAEAASRRITITLSNFEGLVALARAERRPAFHVKLDTGMHRLGFQECEVPRLLRSLAEERLAPAGVYSHLAEARDPRFSERQLSAFERCLEQFRRAGVRPGVRHLLKTEGLLLYPHARYDLVRLGIGLYGYMPESQKSKDKGRKLRLEPVMTWKTVVSEVKDVAAGERIGYGLTHRFRRRARIAVLPVGYWHGFDRGLSGVGEVLIRGRRARVRGRVCMDMVMVDVTAIPGVRIGDEAVLIGRQGQEAVTADEVAARIGTISYEVLTRVNPLIRRIAV